MLNCFTRPQCFHNFKWLRQQLVKGFDLATTYSRAELDLSNIGREFVSQVSPQVFSMGSDLKWCQLSIHVVRAGLILGLRSANERRYRVTPSLIGWAQPRISPVRAATHRAGFVVLTLCAHFVSSAHSVGRNTCTQTGLLSVCTASWKQKGSHADCLIVSEGSKGCHSCV